MLIAFLRANTDVFAWQPFDMPGVPREVIEHHLAVSPDARPIRQKVRRQALERQDVIRLEVEKLLRAGFMREVRHPDWLANPVVVPKANGKWRVCIDYTNLNKACPKDPFPLPRIDQIVNSTASCDLLCFLDAYSGYHQISMCREDEEKTAFVAPSGVYCYTRMPFGLKNAGPTYQRCMQYTLHSQLGQNVEAYVDDLVVKTRNHTSLLEDLDETFHNLRRTRMMLNPEKCVFGVPTGKLLGFLVSNRGIEANPDKIRAIERMRPPTRLKDLQRLAGCMVALGRFIASLGERGLPLFKLLKKADRFEWNQQAEQALEDLKVYLSSPPVLTAPLPEEPLLLYVAATPAVVSAVLVTERYREDRKVAGFDLPSIEVAPSHASALSSELPRQAVENDGAEAPDSVLPVRDVENGVASVPVSSRPPQDVEDGAAPPDGSDPSLAGGQPNPTEIAVASTELSPGLPPAAEPDTVVRPESRPLDRSESVERPGQTLEGEPGSRRVTC